MAGFLEVATIAFVYQLAVLPGEKGQFIIAGLSTRYRPLLVVAAAGTAFAGWTAVEILLGQALRSALSPVYLDAITAGLFLLFAVMLVRSAPARGERAQPATDGGVVLVERYRLPVLDRRLPESAGAFVPIFALMATGEFGDKTQLVTIGLAVTYGATPAIWVGEMLAIVPVSLLNAYLFHRFADRVDRRKAHLAAAALFGFFGLDAVLALATGFSVWEAAVEAVSAAVLAAV